MSKVFSSNTQGNSLPASVPLGFLITAALFILLPLTQIIGNNNDNESDNSTTRVNLQPPPPPPPDLPEPPKEEIKEEEIEMNKETQQVSLAELNLALNVGDGGVTSGGVSIQVFDISDGLDEMVFEIQDLDNPPRPLVQAAPVYPHNLKRQGVEGKVWLIFIVDETGNVRRPRVEKSTNREFDDAALRAIRQWKFEPGEKDNRKVNTRVRLPLNFSLRK